MRPTKIDPHLDGLPEHLDRAIAGEVEVHVFGAQRHLQVRDRRLRRALGEMQTEKGECVADQISQRDALLPEGSTAEGPARTGA